MRRAAAIVLVVALATGAGATGGCAPPSYTVRNGAALTPAPAPALSPPVVRVLHLGDFGDATRQQAAVAREIERSHRRTPFDLGLAAGDLVYPCGPDETLPGAAACPLDADGNGVEAGFRAPQDPAFAVHDRPLAFLGQTPVHVVLGNHDVGFGWNCRGRDDPATARAKACLSVAHRAPQWRMPGRHYAVDAGRARFIVIDSNLVVGDYGGFSLEGEIAFVAAQAEGCLERTCFIVGHHPPVTAGGHVRDATPAYLQRMARVLAAGRGRIRAYLAGHDHDLQHLRAPDGLDVLVSGNGSRGRSRERFEAVSVPGATLLFGSVRWGHGILSVFSDGWSYRFEDDRGEAVYCCTAVGAGRCVPTSCP